MNKPFFVMLWSANETLVPLLDADDELMMFKSVAAASAAAEGTVLGEAFGFEIFHAERGE